MKSSSASHERSDVEAGRTARNPRRFDFRERVRWSDIDSAGIIYFGAYVRFVEIAETELYRELGFTYAEFDRLGMWLPKVHLEFDFFSPAVLDDELLLSTTVGGVGISSVRMHVDVRHAKEDVLLAEATLVSACIDRERRSIALPERLSSALRTCAGGDAGISEIEPSAAHSRAQVLSRE